MRVTSGAQQSPWFVSWFDSAHYYRLYANRNTTEAAAFIDELVERLRPRRGALALDLGCGVGRHSRYLAAKGFCVTGIDLAAGSIQIAKQSERPGLRFLRQDMRVPFGTTGRITSSISSQASAISTVRARTSLWFGIWPIA
jgi:cyclopropane fatty-acyl-phospholipid synthase-like methyltransferase